MDAEKTLHHVVKAAEEKGLIPISKRNKEYVDLIQSISNGVLLKGYYLTRDINTSTKCRNNLIQCPSTVELRKSDLDLDEHYFETNKKEDSFKIKYALKHKGHSVAASIAASGMGATAEAGVCHEHESEDKTKTSEQTGKTYIWSTKYSFLPIKCFSLGHRNYLSKPAIEKLQEIETLLEIESEKAIIIKFCKKFFKEFGSHYYTGTNYFGGIYQWTATYEGEETKTESEAKKMCRKKLKMCFEAGCSVPSGKLSGKLIASRDSGTASADTAQTSSESSEVSTCFCPIGGPKGESKLEDWKEGLISNSETWSVIDREDVTSNKNYQGVWTLIEQSVVSFQDPLTLALAVMEAWESITEKKSKDTFLYKKHLDNAVGKLKTADTRNEDEEKIKTLLLKIDRIIVKINDRLETGTIWEKICDEHVKTILDNLSKTASSTNIRALAEKLSKKSVRAHSVLTSINVMKEKLEKFNDMLTPVHITDPCELDTRQKQVTQEMETALKALHEQDQFQFLFFVSTFRYISKGMFDFSKMRFHYKLSEKTISDLIEGSKNCCKDFDEFDCIRKGTIRTRLFNACLKRLVDSLGVISYDAEFSKEILEWVTKDTRVQDFLEVGAGYISEIKAGKKSEVLELFMEVIDTEHGIGLRKWETIFTLLEKEVSEDQKVALLSGAVGGRGRLPVKPTSVDKINVKISGDADCWISGLDVTADGNILLADNNNAKIKLFSPSGQLLSSLPLDGEPWDVTVIKETEAAVSMFGSPMIQIIDLTDSKHISWKRSITMDGDVRDITGYNNNMVIISCSRDREKDVWSVQMINKDGKMIWAETKDRHGRMVFDRPLYLTIQRGKASDRVIVTDKDRETITVLSADTGVVVKVLEVKGKRPMGVTVDSRDRIYICYFVTGEISVWSADLEEERCLISGMQDLKSPKAIACDRRSGELFVSNWFGDSHIHRFRIVMK